MSSVTKKRTLWQVLLVFSATILSATMLIVLPGCGSDSETEPGTDTKATGVKEGATENETESGTKPATGETVDTAAEAAKVVAEAKAAAKDAKDYLTPVPTLKWLPLVSPQSVENAEAKTEAEMKPYSEPITGSTVKFDMVPIKGGEFTMGSPDDEENREECEGPQRQVKISPFWMGKCEVTWGEYSQWSEELNRKMREHKKINPNAYDSLADAVGWPTPAYCDMSFGMGKDDCPAICMTQTSAQMYCKWLSAKTGRYYRLPTEAEWEYACRAGSKTAYSFGDDPKKGLDDYAWYYDNSEEKYHKVGTKKPNAWGLYDMHGNVAEWVIDPFTEKGYQDAAGKLLVDPVVISKDAYPRVVRGGHWDDDPEMLRSAARRGSNLDEWSSKDPQEPKSVWYHTDADFIGFRVVRPLTKPTLEQSKAYEPDVQLIKEYREAHGGQK